MSFSGLTDEEKKQYIIEVMVGVLMQRFALTEARAAELIAASPLQRMLDGGYADYVLDADENYWLDQIIAGNEELRARRRPGK